MVERLRDAGAAGRHGAHVPRPRAAPAAPLLAARATTASRCPELLDSKTADHRPPRAPAPGPLPVHAGQGPRRRDRVGEVAAHRPRATYAAATAADRRAADPRRPVRAHVRGLRAREGAREPDRLRRPAGRDRRRCSRPTRRRPRRVRARKRWFSVDEYQDTNPLQQRLLELWLGDRRDLCVVGDEDQTIYTFTGRLVGVPDLVRGPLAGRAGGLAGPELPLHAPGAGARQPPDRGGGPLQAPGGHARRRPAAHDRRRHAIGGGGARRAGGLDPGAAGGGDRARRDRRPGPDERAAGADRGGADARRRRLPGARRALLRPAGGRARRWQACAGARDSRRSGRTCVARDPGPLGRGRGLRGGRTPPRATRRGSGRPRSRRCSRSSTAVAAADPAADVASVIADLEARAAHEREGSADGVNLLTYHRAKGLEWDAVFLPGARGGDPARSARRWTTTRPWPRSAASCTWGSRGPGCTSRCPGRSGARPGAARPAASRAGSCWTCGPAAGTGSRSWPGRRRRSASARRRRLGRPGVRGPARVADGARPRGGDAALRHRPRRDARSRSPRRRPRTLAGLRRVKGMGPAKLEKYGDEILAVIEAALGA